MVLIALSKSDEQAILIACAVAGLVVYVIPTVIAVGRRHKNAAPIAVLNFLFGLSLVGWVLALGSRVGVIVVDFLIYAVSLVGWVVALVWALMADQERPRTKRPSRGGDYNPFAPPPAQPAGCICPHCGARILPPAAVVGPVACGNCGRPFMPIVVAPIAPQ